MKAVVTGDIGCYTRCAAAAFGHGHHHRHGRFRFHVPRLPSFSRRVRASSYRGRHRRFHVAHSGLSGAYQHRVQQRAPARVRARQPHHGLSRSPGATRSAAKRSIVRRESLTWKASSAPSALRTCAPIDPERHEGRSPGAARGHAFDEAVRHRVRSPLRTGDRIKKPVYVVADTCTRVRACAPRSSCPAIATREEDGHAIIDASRSASGAASAPSTARSNVSTAKEGE